MMHIDYYDFGKITIDGQDYNRDVIIAGSNVIDNWRRKEGHSLAIEDLDAVITAEPTHLVVGTGKMGQLIIPETTRQFLAAKGIALISCPTETACDQFNHSVADGCNVVGAFHLTC